MFKGRAILKIKNKKYFNFFNKINILRYSKIGSRILWTEKHATYQSKPKSGMNSIKGEKPEKHTGSLVFNVEPVCKYIYIYIYIYKMDGGCCPIQL